MDIQFVSFEQYCNLKKYKKFCDKTIYKTFNELQKYKDTEGNIIDELSLFNKYISECTKDNKELIINKNSMKTEDIKSKEKKERVLGWKENLKLAFQQNKDIDPKNLSEKEKKYWQELQTSDVKKKPKVTLLDKAKSLKEKIIANANIFADKILNKAIAKEEQQKAWETRKEELKAEAAKKRKEAALKKREEKAKKLTQIHASIPTKDTSKKQKAIDKEIEKKHDEKMIAMETKFENFNPKQRKLTKEERIERNRKRAIKLVHHEEIKDKIKHTTKEEREKAAAEARKAAYLAYKAEMQRQASEIEADPTYQARQKKRAKSEQERLNMLAEKRKARMDKLQRVELTQKQKTLKDLEHFKLAQERRNKKKLERRQMYLSKGGIQLPKVKNKVEIRPIVEQPKKQDSSKHRYIVRTQYIDQPSLTGDRVGAIVCLPDKLKDIVKYSFNKMMEKESDKVVGYFIYDSDNPEVCIMEMVNSKYREIDGVTITRLQKQDKTAA